MMLVSYHNGEEGLLEDRVSLLTITLNTVELVVPGTGHRGVNLVVLGLLPPLGTHVGDQVGGVELLTDGDVREATLQPATLLVIQVGNPNGIKGLTVTYFVKLALFKRGEVDRHLLALPLVRHQSVVLMNQIFQAISC